MPSIAPKTYGDISPGAIRPMMQALGSGAYPGERVEVVDDTARCRICGHLFPPGYLGYSYDDGVCASAACVFEKLREELEYDEGFEERLQDVLPGYRLGPIIMSDWIFRLDDESEEAAACAITPTVRGPV